MSSSRNSAGPGAIVTLLRSPALTKAYALSSLITPPLGLAYLAGTLKGNGIETRIVDGVGEDPDKLVPLGFAPGYSVGLDQNEMVERIDPRSDIIGMSCMFSNSWPYDRRLIEKVRKRFPKALIVVGGEHATACADYILNTSPEVDACAKGEGELTMLNLVKAHRAGEGLAKVPGIVFRDGGRIKHNESVERIQDVDTIALPAWELIPLENYMTRGLGHGINRGRNMPLLATRGCPYQCTFCSSPQMWTTRWSARDPALVVDEMEKYISVYKAENFDLYDLTAIIRKDWIIKFANEILARGLKITYQLPSGTRSEAIDGETADHLYRSGCRFMHYAPESGSPDMLKAVKKRIKLPNLLSSLKSVSDRGLSVMVNIIFFPDEKLSDLLQTFLFMLKCSWYGARDITFVPFVPYPGTELYDALIKDGRLPPLSEEYFIDLLTHSDISTVKSYNPRFSPLQVQLARISFLSMFYISNYIFRPHRAVMNVVNILRNRPQTRGEKTVRQLASRLVRIGKMNAAKEKELVAR
jgi:radical SAM superfamily enzyme YgiQ (UPF0313 family)